MFDTNPLSNPGDLFKKKKTVGQRTVDLLKSLGTKYQAPEPEDSMSVLSALGDDPLASTLSLRPGEAQDVSIDVYDPNHLYGGMYKRYGGRKIRGLLGD